MTERDTDARIRDAAPRRQDRSPSAAAGPLPVAVGLISMLGAALLAISQFLPLFHTRIQASRIPIDTVSVGSAHSYALLPIAVVAAVLAVGVWLVASRPALLAVCALGIASLVISLARDLSLAQRQGLKLHAGHYVLAANRVAAGLYAETAGATLLIIASVSGLILLGLPQPRRSEPAGGARLDRRRAAPQKR